MVWYLAKLFTSGLMNIAGTVFAEIFVVFLILDVTFITKFKKLNNWSCRGQHAKLAKLARLFRN